MPYRDFAYFYDELNSEADHDRLAAEILRILHSGGIADGIVADLGCGTGEMSLRLAAAGYDMIAVDASPEMLQMLQGKLENHSAGARIQPVCQLLQHLDLYGTIHAAVCTYDTFNHLPPDALAKAMRQIALFLEPGGLLVFDANTPYKHAHILANNTFNLLTQNNVRCTWVNTLNPDDLSVAISLEITQNGKIYREEFTEYMYPLEELQKMLQKNGLHLQAVRDGEHFTETNPQSQRLLITAKKQ